MRKKVSDVPVSNGFEDEKNVARRISIYAVVLVSNGLNIYSKKNMPVTNTRIISMLAIM